jgi:hypothetical protein
MLHAGAACAMPWPLQVKELRMRTAMLAIVLATLPLAVGVAQQPAPPAAPPPAPAGMAPDIRPGAEVRDATGARVGTVEAVADGMVTLATSAGGVALPLASFAQRDGVLTIGMSEAELAEAARKRPSD